VVADARQICYYKLDTCRNDCINQDIQDRDKEVGRVRRMWNFYGCDKRCKKGNKYKHRTSCAEPHALTPEVAEDDTEGERAQAERAATAARQSTDEARRAAEDEAPYKLNPLPKYPELAFTPAEQPHPPAPMNLTQGSLAMENPSLFERLPYRADVGVDGKFFNNVRILKEMKMLNMEGEGLWSNRYYEVLYNDHKFNFKIPNDYPTHPPSINGFIPQMHSSANKIKDYLDILHNISVKNTLVYCHGRTDFHWLDEAWVELFGDKYKNSNKIYFDINRTDATVLKDRADSETHLFMGDGFGEEILTKNNNLWDFIMIPDCSDTSAIFDAPKALPLISKILLNLKLNGKMYLSKAINNELIASLPGYLGDGYNVEYLGRWLGLGFAFPESVTITKNK
jgi:hypothetical protein